MIEDVSYEMIAGPLLTVVNYHQFLPVVAIWRLRDLGAGKFCRRRAFRLASEHLSIG